MGKSPGKWIKTVLFGKKSPKSNISKGREKLVNKREEVAASNALDNGLALDLTPIKIPRNEEELEPENEESENLSPRNQETNIEASANQDAPPDPETVRLEEAAIKAQAAFRGYMARRAFSALKGIIKLQALIRGHLVRRQAVATLCGMYGIVKLQALVRGGCVRRTNAEFGIQEQYLYKPLEGKLGEPFGISKKLSKLSKNTFICKLLASSTSVMALHLQYAVGDPNSVLSWLERWSLSYFWKPVPQSKKIRENISLKKKSTISIGEAQISKSKRTNRKLPTANFESVQVQTNPKLEKPKQNIRKISSQLSDHEQETPQSELEKVKRNLRKIHNPIIENTILSEVEGETPKQHLEKATVTEGNAVSESGVFTSNEKIKKDEKSTISNALDVEIISRPLNNEVSDIPNTYQVTVDSMPLIETQTTTKDRNISSANEDKNETTFKDENSPLTNGDSIHKEDLTGRRNQKYARKASILTKQECAENGLQNSQTIPSYMAATESAKAKLRSQGSPKFEQDESEKSNTSGRHSLPSSTNSKVDSHTPRTRRSVQSGGKGGHRSDKTISSSQGTNGKVIQAEWRR